MQQKMKKWAIVKNEGEHQIWRYLTTKEEVAPYPYILYAIEKYGWDDIMPCCMNSCGGYTTFPPDRIVNIIESPTKPDIKMLHLYIYDQPDFCCGWISPAGHTYSCSHYGHLDLAEDIVNEFWADSYKNWRAKNNNICAPDEYLIQDGWIKITADKQHFCLWDPDKMTNAAIAKLDELEAKWHDTTQHQILN